MALSLFTTLTPAVGRNNWKSLARPSPGLWGRQEARRLAATISSRPPPAPGHPHCGFLPGHGVKLGSPQSIPQASLPPGCASTSSSVKWETNESSGFRQPVQSAEHFGKGPYTPVLAEAQVGISVGVGPGKPVRASRTSKAWDLSPLPDNLQQQPRMPVYPSSRSVTLKVIS